MPRNENALEHLDQRIKDDSDRREQKYRRESKRGVEFLIGDYDELSQPTVAADEFTNNRSNDFKRDCNLHSAENFR